MVLFINYAQLLLIDFNTDLTLPFPRSTTISLLQVGKTRHKGEELPKAAQQANNTAWNRIKVLGNSNPAYFAPPPLFFPMALMKTCLESLNIYF